MKKQEARLIFSPVASVFIISLLSIFTFIYYLAKHFEISLVVVVKHYTGMIILVKFETIQIMYTEVTKYLLQTCLVAFDCCI